MILGWMDCRVLFRQCFLGRDVGLLRRMTRLPGQDLRGL
jgi:hypothetical protein